MVSELLLGAAMADLEDDSTPPILQAGPSRQRRAVVLVGLAGHPKARAIVDDLKARGLEIFDSVEARSVPEVLRKTPRCAFVVYNRASTREAHEVLAGIDLARRRAPVVVLVDETDFGDYYSLMRQGALEYFEISERPELIARGIEWATESLAS